MQVIEEIGITSWTERAPAIADALETGAVVLAPRLNFELSEQDRQFLSPSCLDGKSKNVSYRPTTGALGGASAKVDQPALTAMLRRYSEQVSALMNALCPEYRGKLLPGFTSFRPAEIAGRATSWRKDDTRLHVDAFPSRPLQGLRIIRVFSNVNPSAPRMWRVGDQFENVATTFLPKIALPVPGSAWLLHALRVTKTRRTLYDHLMLGIHDGMKADDNYQRQCRQISLPIPPGATWACFTDSVSH